MAFLIKNLKHKNMSVGRNVYYAIIPINLNELIK